MFRIILSSILFFNVAGCHANTNYKVYIDGNQNQCKYDYGEINFCSKGNVDFYSEIIKREKNFDQKYVVSLVNDALVVIDPSNKEVFPLYGQYMDGENDSGKVITKRKIEFSKLSNKICINGKKYAYRDIVENGKYCYTFLNKKFITYDPNIKALANVSTIVDMEINKIKSIQLPFNSKLKINSENILLGSNVSDKLYSYISTHGGDLGVGNSIIRLQNNGNILVFLSFFTDEGERGSYSLNTYNKGKLRSVNFGTGSEFWIDKKYNIKVKSYDGKLAKIDYYKISDDGVIMRGDAPFN